MKEEGKNDDAGLQPGCNGHKTPGGVTGKGWRPGQSGNPSGKRRGTVSLAAALARNLTRKDADKIAQKLIAMAKRGDIAALKLLFERLDGADIERRIEQLEHAVAQRRN